MPNPIPNHNPNNNNNLEALESHKAAICPSAVAKTVPCPKGCGVLLSEDSQPILEKHARTCQMEPVPCPNGKHGCAATPLRKTYERHLKGCPYILMTCANTGCKESFVRKLQRQHIENCGFQLEATLTLTLIGGSI